MQRKSGIRWRKTDLESLTRTVRNFNAKIDRLLKKNPDLIDILPEKISKKELKNKIDTRADFNRELKSLQRFSKKNSEEIVKNNHGLEITKWALKETSIKVAIINRRKSKELKQANINPTQKGIMGSLKENALKPKKINFHNKTKKEWSKFINSVERQIRGFFTQDRADNYKQNYLEAIDTFLTHTEKGRELYKLIESLPADFIYKNYYEDAVLQIQFTSDELEAEIIAEVALEHWKEIADLKGIDY